MANYSLSSVISHANGQTGEWSKITLVVYIALNFVGVWNEIRETSITGPLIRLGVTGHHLQGIISPRQLKRSFISHSSETKTYITKLSCYSNEHFEFTIGSNLLTNGFSMKHSYERLITGDDTSC